MLFRVVILIAINLVVIKAIFIPILKSIVHIRRLKSKCENTFGVITGEVMDKDLDNANRYAPIIKFKTKQGSEVLVQGDDYLYRRQQIGKRVRVLYNPQFPEDAIINPEKSAVFKIFLICFVILILVLIDVGVMYKLANS
jgi:hypothetical protein